MKFSELLVKSGEFYEILRNSMKIGDFKETAGIFHVKILYNACVLGGFLPWGPNDRKIHENDQNHVKLGKLHGF